MKKFALILIVILSVACLFACASSPKAVSPVESNPADADINNGVPSELPQTSDSLAAESDLLTLPSVETPVENPVHTPVETPVTTVKYIKSLVSGLTVRSGAGTTFASVGTIDKNQMLILIETSGGWHKTYYKNTVCYVSAGASYSKIMEFDMGSENVENILSVGYKLLGFPYVYGAERLHYGDGKLNTAFNPQKYDCSSLMQYMFFYGANVNLKTTTRTQVSQGITVNKADIKRGDLLFFTNASRQYNTGIERVGHVAIYLGNNYILHTASTVAVIEEISATRWGYFIQANRVI